MIVLRWSAYTVALIAALALVSTPVSLASAFLALMFAVAFLVVAWTFREPRATAAKSRWIEDIDEDHPDALGSLDRRERQRRGVSEFYSRPPGD